ncbi:MAG: alkaline phosphatase family protein [candidate division Zixibacteria bacterium]|nr:alkaline phosphatase family protein [candidate division Zixibacteria bacterium]
MKQFEHCIIFLIDGARPDVMEKMMKRGDLPNIQRYLLEPGSYTKAVTAFPSTTGPAYIPILTGCYPGTADVPGIRWFDKEESSRKRLSLRRQRSYMGVEAPLFNSDLRKDKLTLFEIFKNSINIFNPLTRGINSTNNLTRFSKTLYYLFVHLTSAWQIVDWATHRYLFKAIRKKPEFIFALFPAVDCLSHFTHPFSKTVLEAYLKVDEFIGKTVQQLKRKGILDQTLLILTSDHGLTPTHTHLDLIDFLDKRDYRAFHHPRITRRQTKAAVMVSGNSMAHIYLKNGQGWGKRIYFEELEKNHTRLLSDLIDLPQVALVACADEDGGVCVLRNGGKARIRERDGNIYYSVEGEDPFGYKGLPRILDHTTSLEHTFDSDYPDALVQLIQIFKSRRSGDIILSAQKGFDLRARFEWPEHKASHGSLHREHMLVPLFINTKIETRKIRTADIFPSILELLGRENNNEIDGKSFVPAYNGTFS